MYMLLVEDDAIIASGLAYALEAEGWTVTHCASARAALDALGTQSPSLARAFDFALLDLSLPDGDGHAILEAIRRVADIPVIFVTAADDEGNTVKALEMGADDYITKPFRLRELLARIKTIQRRYIDSKDAEAAKYAAADAKDAEAGVIEAAAAVGAGRAKGASGGIGSRDAKGGAWDVLSLGGDGGDGGAGGIRIDTAKAKVSRNGEEVSLTAMEYRLLLLFAQNKGRILSRKQILESLWDVAGNFVNDNTLTVYIKRLREKLEDDPQNPQIIQTVRGLGYRASED